MLRVNLDGAFYTSQEAVKHWVARWGEGDEYGGSLVFTSSGSAFFGQPRGEHYGGSKAAIIAMSKGIAVEYARYKVRSNSIVPGWIDTEMASGALHWDKFIERNMPRTPARRWGEGKDFSRHRRLPRQPGQQLPHRRRHHDRRRLLHLLERPSTPSGQDPLRHVLGAYLRSVVRAPLPLVSVLRERSGATSTVAHPELPCRFQARPRCAAPTSAHLRPPGGARAGYVVTVVSPTGAAASSSAMNLRSRRFWFQRCRPQPDNVPTAKQNRPPTPSIQ